MQLLSHANKNISYYDNLEMYFLKKNISYEVMLWLSVLWLKFGMNLPVLALNEDFWVMNMI